jgi:plastocyanin
VSRNSDRPSPPRGPIARAAVIQLAAALTVLTAGAVAQAATPAASTEPAVAPATSAASGPSTRQAAPADATAPSSPPASAPAGIPQRVQPPPAVVALRITGPTSVIAGRPVRFAAVRPPPTTLEFRWGFGGSGRYSAPTALPSTRQVFRRPDTFVVSLIALPEHGGDAVAHLRVVVLAAHRSATHRRAPIRRVSARTRSPVAGAATGASVAIKDFSFGPSTITIHAGDTVTWANRGPSNHTATAAGMFNTGVLHAGQSASHLFTRAGTFSYRCSIHPFMRGTVTVLSASSSNAAPVGVGHASGQSGLATGAAVRREQRRVVGSGTDAAQHGLQRSRRDHRRARDARARDGAASGQHSPSSSARPQAARLARPGLARGGRGRPGAQGLR